MRRSPLKEAPSPEPPTVKEKRALVGRLYERAQDDVDTAAFVLEPPDDDDETLVAKANALLATEE